MTEPRSVLFCRATQQGFLRLLTRADVLAPYGNPPLTNAEAWAAYEALVGDERIVMADGEPAGLQEAWARWATTNRPFPKLWVDAYLAAYARAGGYRLVTTDSAFRHFPELDLLLIEPRPQAPPRKRWRRRREARAEEEDTSS